MSFFLPHKLSCFICKTTIGERIEAVRMFYAHPDDVGAVARSGRAWTHRRCWEAWDMRAAWSSSATRLMEADQARLVEGRVSCFAREGAVLLEDLWSSVSLLIPMEKAAGVAKASRIGGEVLLHADLWKFEHQDGKTLTTATSNGEAFERFHMDSGRWSTALELLASHRT